MSAWPFQHDRVVLYDSFTRPGYPPSPSNPQGWHRAHDASRRRTKNGTYISLAGSRIYSFYDGKVIQEGWDNSWGWYVRIRSSHNNNVWTVAHLKYRSRLRVGDTVRDGRSPKTGKWSRKRQSFVGYCGSTGNSTAPHIHTEIRDGGDGGTGVYVRDPRVNPYPRYVELKKEALRT